MKKVKTSDVVGLKNQLLETAAAPHTIITGSLEFNPKFIKKYINECAKQLIMQIESNADVIKTLKDKNIVMLMEFSFKKYVPKLKQTKESA